MSTGSLFEEGQLLVNVNDNSKRYAALQLLGAGTSGEVWRVVAPSDDDETRTAIIKFFDARVYRTQKKLMKKLRREYLFARWSTEIELHEGQLRPCENGSVCPYEVVVLMDQTGALFYGLMFNDNRGIDLDTYYKEYIHPALESDPDDATFFSVDQQVFRIATLLAYRVAILHGLGAVHCDIKPPNILVTLDGGRVVDVFLIDFGLACTDRAKELLTQMGEDPNAIDCASVVDADGIRKYFYTGTPAYTDPQALTDSTENSTFRLFTAEEHISLFKSFDLFSVALTLWYAWAPRNYEMIGKQYVLPIPSRPTLLTPRNPGFIPPGNIPIDDRERTILQNSSVCFIFSKMCDNLERRLPADQIYLLFRELEMFVRNAIESQ